MKHKRIKHKNLVKFEAEDEQPKRKRKIETKDAGVVSIPVPVTADHLRQMSGHTQERRLKTLHERTASIDPSTQVPELQVNRSSEMGAPTLEAVSVALSKPSAVPGPGIDMQRELVPLLSINCVEDWFREATSGERACQRGMQCQGRKVNNMSGFTFVEHVQIKSGSEVRNDGGSQMCMLCLIDAIGATSLQCKINGTKLPDDIIAAPFRVSNIKGEYSKSRMLYSSRTRYDGPMHGFPVYGMVGWVVKTKTPSGPRFMIPPPQPNDRHDIF